tara:strand:- start:233 stop:631 length:399 start_codon:yes stop_codon:yes gene_type:complete
MILIVAIYLLVSSTNLALANSSGKIKEWSNGDLIAVVSICRDEETILKVARADTISEEKVISIIRGLNAVGECLRLSKPLLFHIESSLIAYKDFNGIDSLVLGVNGKTDNFLGFVLAAGVFVEKKKIKGQDV